MQKLYTLFLCIATLTAFSQTTVQDDFEGNGTITSWQQDNSAINIAFTNPVKEGINTSNRVLKYVDNGSQYANFYFDIAENYDLSENYTFSFKIYIPQSSLTGSQTNQVSLKLQNNTIGSPWTSQSEIIKAVSLNQWQTVTFNFKDDDFLNYNSNAQNPTNRSDFNRVLIQVNGENNTDKVTAYIDDFLYDGTVTANNNSNTDPVYDNLVWSDEFDGETGEIVPVDSNKWFHQTQLPDGNSWFNNELQHYTDKIENTFINNGVLSIVAKKENFTDQNRTKSYTSARLNSRYAFTYGKVEVRAKMPFGTGTWPAIWMLNKNITEAGGFWASTHGTTAWPACGEIDIMEHWGNNQNYISSAMHTTSSHGGTVNHGGQIIPTASTAFHVYELTWTPERMVFSVDGNVHYIYNPEIKNNDTWPFYEDQYFLLNIAIEKGGTAQNFTESAMEIDYIRVFQESTASVAVINALENSKLTPNPVNEELTIQVDENLKFEKATLYSITGKKIHTFYQNSFKQTHDTSFLKSGLYLLRIETATASKTFKLLKN
ncbi:MULTISPECIES: family 16 glycosylhydrolase [unclassified Polaribacter]|uniref:family 16 glycosylhydrolase n=1 Tax=unclassified Polaribacter TaxID=196858 RepID=UPI0011BF72D3|nr:MULTISPECIES: family 16 glycosylhydrolase [unclassified Polaribacter]TXD53887.1 family 16 glycosylhydrolase [Polaribacter sp. IC063]TXD58543.1 family 16 glycosylhydrolase [Polaribacter sp. IC066]